MKLLLIAILLLSGAGHAHAQEIGDPTELAKHYSNEQCHVNGPIVCDPMNSDPNFPDNLRYDFTDPNLVAWAHAKCYAEEQSNIGAEVQDWSPLCSVWIDKGRP